MRILFCLWIVQGFAAFNLTWGAPAINLDSNPPIGDTDGNAVIAIDPIGNGIAVWGRTVGQKTAEDIWAASYNHSLRTWTGAIKISGGGNAANGRTAIDLKGNAIFLWEEGFPTQIMCRYLSSDGVWTPNLSSPPLPLQESVSAQLSPQIKIDDQGNGLAVWIEYKKGIHQIHSAKKPLNSGWIPLGMVSLSGSDASFSLTKPISMNRSGDALLVWEEKKQGAPSIYGARYSQGKWGTPFPILEDPEQRGDSPAAGIDEQGNSLVAWHREGKIESRTLIQGVLSTPILASDPSYRSIHPDLALDREGNGVLVYERYNPLHKFIAGTTLPFGNLSWTPPIDISAPSPADAPSAGYPVLSLNEIGDGVVIWKEFTGKDTVIQGAGYSLGTWSCTKTLSSLKDHSGAPFPGYDISVGVNLAGQIIAVWPEDPTFAGSFQIKANAAIPTQLKGTVGTGLATIAPLPPLPEPATILSGVASGHQIVHKFPAHTDLINILTWTSSSGAAQYRIYRNNLSSLIGVTQNTRFEDHQRIPRKRETYLVTAIDQHGQESTPMTLVVEPR